MDATLKVILACFIGLALVYWSNSTNLVDRFISFVKSKAVELLYLLEKIFFWLIDVISRLSPQKHIGLAVFFTGLAFWTAFVVAASNQPLGILSALSVGLAASGCYLLMRTGIRLFLYIT